MLGKRPSIYLVEDEPLFGEELSLYFSVRGFNVMGSGIGADDVYYLMRKRRDKNVPYRAHVILADLDIMTADTIHYSYLIRDIQPDVKFIFFTMHDRLEKRVIDGVKALKGVVVKRPEKAEEMVEIVRSLLESSSPAVKDVVIIGGEENEEDGKGV